MNKSLPHLTALVVTSDSLRSVDALFCALARQTIAGEVQAVIAGPARILSEPLSPDAAQLHSVRRVATPDGELNTRMRIAALREAEAPIVAFTEEHCFPEPHWAESLLRRHAEPQWIAVGPTVTNANPATVTSWANLVTEYGPWLHPHPGGPVAHLPSHNSSYKREFLLSLGDSLERELEVESPLHFRLTAERACLYCEPSARIAHLNFATFGASIPMRFRCGRVFAASRARGWGLIRRAGYSLAFPMIAAVRCRRCLAPAWRSGALQRPLFFPTLAVLLLSDAFGEAVGYLAGSGDAFARLSEIEFHRERFAFPEK